MTPDLTGLLWYFPVELWASTVNATGLESSQRDVTFLGGDLKENLAQPFKQDCLPEAHAYIVHNVI